MTLDLKMKNTFSYRVLKIFLVLLIFVYLLYYRIYHAGYDMLTSEISRSLYSKATYLTDTMEEEIGRIQRLEYECVNEDTLYYTINTYSIMKKSEKIKKLLEIQRRMKILHESSTYISEVFVYIPALSRRISSVHGVEFVGERLEELKEQQERATQSQLFFYEGSLYLGSSYPYNVVTTHVRPQYTLLIKLSDSELKKELGSLSEEADSGICLTDSEGAFSFDTGKEISLDSTGEDLEQGIAQVKNPEDGKKYTVLKVHSDFLNMDLFAYISNKIVYRDLKIYQNIFSMCMTVMLLMMAVFIYYTHYVLNRPIRTLVEHIGEMEKGNLSVRIREKRKDEFGYVYVAFNQMAESLQNQMEINYRQKLLMQQAELKHLQSQINPHFLYNSFFTLYRMGKDEDYESIVEFSSYLSEYYRYITKNSQKEVFLKMEVEHARRYGMIQAIRFRRRLKVVVNELPEKFNDIQVPRLILQPILENAFEHGLNNIERNGLLKVWYEEKEKLLFIHVEDNGSGMTLEEMEQVRKNFEKTADSVENGLCNINQRLKIRFGETCGILIERGMNGGTCCSLVLPAEKKEEEKEDVISDTGSR